MLLNRALKHRLPAICASYHVPADLRSIRAFASQLPPRLVIAEKDIEESFLKGSGPGGQKIVWLHTLISP